MFYVHLLVLYVVNKVSFEYEKIIKNLCLEVALSVAINDNSSKTAALFLNLSEVTNKGNHSRVSKFVNLDFMNFDIF